MKWNVMKNLMLLVINEILPSSEIEDSMLSMTKAQLFNF